MFRIKHGQKQAVGHVAFASVSDGAHRRSNVPVDTCKAKSRVAAHGFVK